MFNFHFLSMPQHDYDEMVNWYRDLSLEYSDIVIFVPSIGKSLEGRDTPAVHITAAGTTPKQKYYLQCLIHARESILPAL